VQSSLATKWADGDGDGYGWDGYVLDYELSAPISDDDRDASLRIAEEALRPASEQVIVAELGRLRALTVSRDIGQDLTLVFAAYTSELLKYPPDAIRRVLRAWPKTQRFWPSMSELVQGLDRLVRPRHALRNALRQPYRPAETSPDWAPPPSEKVLAAISDLLAAHGIVADEYGRMRPPEREPLTSAQRRQVRNECAVFRLPDEDDPRVQERLRQMGVG
jgi:hypothetical protein